MTASHSPVTRVTANVRLFFQGAYLSYVALFTWFAPWNYLASKIIMPLGQILFWDRVLVRLSRALDPLLGYRVGKSILGVWRKSDR